jgi:Ca-activated chloride channel family protein
MRFLWPDAGWWVLAALVAVSLLQWRVRRRFAASTTVRWLAGSPAYRATVVRRLPAVLLAVSLLLTGVALMDPVLPYSEAEVRSRGLDIVMALDLSASMQEPMDAPSPSRAVANGATGKTRLDATKEAIKAFVRHRRDDRIALIVFSDHAYVVSPLTLDYDYLLRYIDLVDAQILSREGMTAIGDGLALSNYLLDRMAKSADRNRVIVLFTDGENNTGRDPIETLKESNAANIRVHFIGVDLEQDIRRKPQVQMLLQSVIGYGGRYVNASTERDLNAASAAIDKSEKGSLVTKMHVRDVPVYQWFAIPALVCLALALTLRAIPFFVDQT